MRRISLLLCAVLIYMGGLYGQTNDIAPQTKIMTLGVFHFAYPNLDAVKTEAENKISVLEEPYQSEIIAIAHAIGDFKPTIIAIEVTPDKQRRIDSLYLLYRNNNFTLGKDEI